MQMIKRRLLQTTSTILFVACVLCLLNVVALCSDYPQKSIAELIDDLTQIDSQSPGIDSAADYDSFIADDASGSFQMGVLGIARPKVPPQMRELVRRGPVALPELLKHIDDTRPTKLRVGNIDEGSKARRVGVNLFMFTYFSDEYDPRLRSQSSESGLGKKSQRIEKDFQGSYTVKVGDVCLVLIGQIVNRRLFAVRYQPSAGLVVNSPVEYPALAEMVRRDWSNADSEPLRSSLMADIQGANRPAWAEDEAEDMTETIYPALERLRLNFPDAYAGLKGADLKKRASFEKQESKRRFAKSR